MTIEVANRLLLSSLSGLYDEREASSISSMIMEHLTGMPKNLRLIQKTDLLSAKQEELLIVIYPGIGKSPAGSVCIE